MTEEVKEIIEERYEMFHKIACGLQDNYEKWKKLIPIYNTMYTHNVLTNDEFQEYIRSGDLRELAEITVLEITHKNNTEKLHDSDGMENFEL